MQDSALAIIRQTASELGLPVPVEGVASKDTLSLQLISLLNSAGYELCFAHDWEELNKTHTITTVAGQNSYPLPTDFARLINQTMADSESTPIPGPVSPQEWQTLSATDTGPMRSFRIKGQNILIEPTPVESDLTYTFEYISDAWLQSYLVPGTYTNTIQHDLAIPVFNFFLMVKFLKLKLWQAKGLDTTALTTDMDRLFIGLTGGNKGAPILSIGRCRRYGSDLQIEIPQSSAPLGFPYTFPFILG